MSEPNGFGDDVQDPVPISNYDAQPPNPTMVDGIRSHDSTQPTKPSRQCVALDSKLGPQDGFSQPPGNFLKEVSSNPSNLTHLL